MELKCLQSLMYEGRLARVFALPPNLNELQTNLIVYVIV